jgi:hypothetical protein
MMLRNRATIDPCPASYRATCPNTHLELSTGAMPSLSIEGLVSKVVVDQNVTNKGVGSGVVLWKCPAAYSIHRCGWAPMIIRVALRAAPPHSCHACGRHTRPHFPLV